MHQDFGHFLLFFASFCIGKISIFIKHGPPGPQPIAIIIIKKCPKLLRIYGNNRHCSPVDDISGRCEISKDAGGWGGGLDAL